MALYIKDPTVGQMVEQNRARPGVRTKTDAVRIALQHELDRVEEEIPPREKMARLAATGAPPARTARLRRRYEEAHG